MRLPCFPTQIDLSWKDNSKNETEFVIWRKKGKNGRYAELTSVKANVTSYKDIGLKPKTIYFYKIKAVNNSGDSDFSVAASAATKKKCLSFVN